MTVNRVDVRSSVVDLSLVEYIETPDPSSFESSAGALDPWCEADFNPITFVVRLDAAETAPPWRWSSGRHRWSSTNPTT